MTLQDSSRYSLTYPGSHRHYSLLDLGCPPHTRFCKDPGSGTTFTNSTHSLRPYSCTLIHWRDPNPDLQFSIKVQENTTKLPYAYHWRSFTASVHTPLQCVSEGEGKVISYGSTFSDRYELE
ncbi:hypothetical protein AVEN_179411-1 [Araneus ventricosus]|uniref:Uncharacterized protein n=1 Tax=Araneus ventricosus TaxID=182803 RepID=A0A4Y2BEU8_ARAVE|nr:hypothetical protein AVEN_179411-1 [Araneus ventricosus]